jgi:hypothetical protein
VKIKDKDQYCNHAYTKRLTPDSIVCLDCGTVIKPGEFKIYLTDELVMPPKVFLLSDIYWKARNPWPRITGDIARKYGWYGTMIYNREYLVMPVMANGTAIFYSARCLTDCKQTTTGMYKGFPPKYSYPAGRKKVMWKSWEFSSGDARDIPLSKEHILIGEGVADAVWLSQIAPSAALLGSHGEIDRPFILVLDGDVRGIDAAFQIAQESKKRTGRVDMAKTVVLPSRIDPITKKATSDPTDFSIEELRNIIWEQTGIRFTG